MSQMARSLGFLLMNVSVTSNNFHGKQMENSAKNFLSVQLHVLLIAYSVLYIQLSNLNHSDTPEEAQCIYLDI